MRAVVFGCGPAGLMATHALAALGHDVIVVSKKRKSEMYGAQYLHMPIPGMTEKPGREISYLLRGTAEEYKTKVYGRTLPRGMHVSPEEHGGDHMAWDIRSTYDNLWDTYGEYVQEQDLTSASISDIKKHLAADFAFTTVPAHQTCVNDEHSFMYEEVWAVGDAPERGVFCPVSVEPYTIVCNGEEAPAWYRASNVFNRKTAEWPVAHKPPIDNISLVQKPLRTTCDCHPGIIRLGRFGKWEKGILSTDAWTTTRGVMERRGNQQVLF